GEVVPAVGARGAGGDDLAAYVGGDDQRAGQRGAARRVAHSAGQAGVAAEHEVVVERLLADDDGGGLRLVGPGRADEHVGAAAGRAEAVAAVAVGRGAADLAAAEVDQGDHRGGDGVAVPVADQSADLGAGRGGAVR